MPRTSKEVTDEILETWPDKGQCFAYCLGFLIGVIASTNDDYIAGVQDALKICLPRESQPKA